DSENNAKRYLPALGDTTLSSNSPKEYILIDNGQTLRFAGQYPFEVRSISFSMTNSSRFAIEGVVCEFDADDRSAGTKIYLGGLEGIGYDQTPTGSAGSSSTQTEAPKTRAVFVGSDIADKGIMDVNFEFDAKSDTTKYAVLRLDGDSSKLSGT